MNKQALQISPIKAGLAAAGLGGVGGGVGYMVARNKAKKALAQQAQSFAVYNEEENQAIADDAFNQGAEYAAAAIKQSSFKGAPMNEFEKQAKASALKGILKDLYVNGIKDLMTARGHIGSAVKSGMPKELAKKEHAAIMKALRPEALKNVIAGTATLGGLGGAGYLALRKESSLNKEAGVVKEIKDAMKNIYLSSFSKNKDLAKTLAKMKKDPKISVKDYLKHEALGNTAVRQERIKNLALAGLTGTALAGAGVGAYDLAKSSELSKEAKKSAIKDFIKKHYTQGFEDLSALNKDIHTKENPLGMIRKGSAVEKEMRAQAKREIAMNVLKGTATLGGAGALAYGAHKVTE